MALFAVLRRLNGALGNIQICKNIGNCFRVLVELYALCLKQFRAGIFGGVFFLVVFAMSREGVLGIPRYDALLIFALIMQICMIYYKVESITEAKAIVLFHVAGLCLEFFKVSAGIQSWEYPDFAYTKIGGVPLFAGFMYAAVGSYMMQSWKLLKVRIEKHPPYWLSLSLAILLYANFFLHHFILDLRWYLAAFALGLYAQSWIVIVPLDREWKMPLVLAFIIVGFFMWLSENLATYFGIWRYPTQIGIWTSVQVDKWPAWTLLSILSFSIVTSLEQIRSRIQFIK